MKTLIEIHALQNYAPSNLNRDDTGAPKDALFGGTRRARVSSQCLKRAVRQHFGVLAAKGDLAQDDLGDRTKRVLGEIVRHLTGLGRSEGEAQERAISALAAVELTIKDDGKSQYLLFLGKREIASLAQVIHEKWELLTPQEAPAADAKKGGKAKKQAAQGADPELRKAMDKVIDGGKALDVALFGRMLADMPAKNQFAACQVAHAISTHAVEREFDYYTAVDDLKPEETAGADMIGTVEFNSACFYRYAVLDWAKLLENLQGDEELATRGLAAFLEGFVVAEPTGKQNSFAAHNPPEFVAVTVRREGAPRNLANAFEVAIRPKRGESLTRLSAQRLVEKAQQLKAAYGGEETTHVLDLAGAAEGFGVAAPSLADLVSKTLQAVRS